MRIDTSSLHASRKTSQATPVEAGRAATQPGQETGGDNVTVSSRARMLALARNALDVAPQIRTPVVEAARVKLSGGAAACDGEEIARAMIESIASPNASESR